MDACLLNDVLVDSRGRGQRKVEGREAERTLGYLAFTSVIHFAHDAVLQSLYYFRALAQECTRAFLRQPAKPQVGRRVFHVSVSTKRDGREGKERKRERERQKVESCFDVAAIRMRSCEVRAHLDLSFHVLPPRGPSLPSTPRFNQPTDPHTFVHPIFLLPTYRLSLSPFFSLRGAIEIRVRCTNFCSNFRFINNKIKYKIKLNVNLILINLEF